MGVGDRQLLVAEEIIKAWRSHGDGSLDFDKAAGRAFIEGIYAGNLKAWQARRRKDASFKKVAAILQKRVSATRLYRAVATYALLQALPATAEVAMSHQLCASSYHSVLGLPDEAAWRILAEAAAENLTVVEIRRRAARERQQRRGGRLPAPPSVLLLRRLARVNLAPLNEPRLGAEVTELPAEERMWLGLQLRALVNAVSWAANAMNAAET